MSNERNRFGTWPCYSEECVREVGELLRAGGTLSRYRANPAFGLGPQEGSHAEKLEREIEKAFKVKHAVVCNSGTAALHMALAGLDLVGAEVITSPFTFSATAAAILHAGGIPKFADVDPYTYCITKETVKRAITKRTKAILPVSIFGWAVDVRDFADFGLPVIEDACQAVGARVDGVYAGTGALAGAISFNGGKNLPAGEGGALLTNSTRVAEHARLLANHGENFKWANVGLNYRMTELEACVARHGLKALEERNRQRYELASTFLECRYDKLRGGTYFQYPENQWRHSYYVLPFTYNGFQRRRKFFVERVNNLVGQPVMSGGYITPPLHHYPAFKKFCKRELKVVDELSFRTLCLLSCARPPATVEDMRSVAEKMEEALR